MEAVLGDAKDSGERDCFGLNESVMFCDVGRSWRC